MSRIFVLSCLFLLGFFSAKGQGQISTTNIFYPEYPMTPKEFFDHQSSLRQTGEELTFEMQNKGFHKFNQNHIKYRPHWNDIPFYGCDVTLHLKKGKVDHVTGVIPQRVGIQSLQTKDMKEILNLLQSTIQTESENTIENQIDTEILYSELVITDRLFPEKSGNYCLAFHIQLNIPSTEDHREYLVNAVTGDIIFSQSLVCNYFPKGTAPSYHYGTVEIETEQVEANKYILRDVTRGNGNSTHINTSNGDILPTDNDNIWEKFPTIELGHVAYDAHFCTMRFYDFLIDRFEYSGINGNGRSMNARVNINNGADFVNASWNNVNAAFGNGNCHYHPLTTRSIVGHEFAHGITSENAKLVYSGESGAINEGFSDIIGKAFEMIDDPANFEWPIGHEIVATRFAKPLRSMEDPTIYNNPKMYKGKHWRDGGSVHSNSGVLNHWYYLLIEGGSGVNEMDTAYNVSPMEIYDVLDLVFLCQTSYLAPASTYPDLYEYSILACESLFGPNSPQLRSVLEAWKAVGLPYEGTPIENYDDLVLSAKIKTDPNNSYTCYSNEFPEINLSISNKGTIFYPKGTILTASFTRNGQRIDKSLTLPDSLPPDSTLIISVLDYELITQTEYYSIEINLLHNDHVQSNNRFYLYFQNFATSGVDLQISGISLANLNCFSEELVFTVRVKNQSCFTAPAGTNILLYVENKDNGQSYEFNHSTVLAMGPRQETSITARIPYDWQSLNFGYSFISPQDSIAGNNTSSYTINDKGVIQEPILYTFENDDFELDFKHNSPYSKYNFEDEFYFRTKTNFSTNNSPCLEEDKNFKNINSGVAQYTVAEACLDVTGFHQPGLRFDMRQFRSDFYGAFPELDGNSTILKLEFTSPDQNFFPEPLKNVESGLVESHEYLLTKGFKGLFKIIAFTSRHDGTANINGKNDVILLDNMELFDLVSSDDQSINQTVLLTPNPVGDYFKISTTSKKISSVKVIDITGKEYSAFHFQSPVQEISLPSYTLPGGIYLTEITLTEGVVVKKFIK